MNRTKPLSRGSGPKRGSPKRTQPKRFWGDAEEKRGPCRAIRLGGCGGPVELAHVIGRVHDPTMWQFLLEAGFEYVGFDRYVRRESVIPLCRIHHDRYDGRAQPKFEALPLLSLDEQLQAVRDAGGIALALRRISGRDAA
jgi:hypothetical protein